MHHVHDHKNLCDLRIYSTMHRHLLAFEEFVKLMKKYEFNCLIYIIT
jgi:hypothetical protein